jgi:hypothetical protein
MRPPSPILTIGQHSLFMEPSSIEEEYTVSDWTNDYVTTGTTTPIYVPRNGRSKIIEPGKGYFQVQVISAQAAFHGSFWTKVKSLIVTSQVTLNHPLLGSDPLRAIQRSIAVQKNRAEQLGMSPNLIKLVPATMDHISISIDFILDTEDRLAMLGGLINDDAFTAAISLAPGAAVVARTIGGLAQKVLQTFLHAEQRKPILQFSGDFNIADGLRDGLYVILGTRDEQYPLPNRLPKLEVRDGRLLVEGRPVTQLSYIVLSITGLDIRTRDLNGGAEWDAKLRRAETIASDMELNPFIKSEERNKAWEECLEQLRDARILISADPNYLRSESNQIIRAVYADCLRQIFGEENSRNALLPRTGGRGPIADSAGALQERQDERALLAIGPDEDLAQSLDEYAEHVAQARRVIAAAGIQ